MEYLWNIYKMGYDLNIYLNNSKHFIWGFPEIGGTVYKGNPIQIDDFSGYPYYRKPPYVWPIFYGDMT